MASFFELVAVAVAVAVTIVAVAVAVEVILCQHSQLLRHLTLLAFFRSHS